MRIFPAVDIKDGRCVRLFQGRADRVTVYGEDPVAQACAWADAGATRLHLVDLDGAFEGRPKNMDLVLRIVDALEIEVEVGGGIRTQDVAQELIQAGAARVIVGTRAAEDPAFLRDLAGVFPGKINLGLDAAGGLVVTKGWVHTTEMQAVDLVRQLAGAPLGEVIYTDIARDGALAGPNFDAIAAMQKACPFPLTASGGVTRLADLDRLNAMGVYAAIVGKALYTGDIRIDEALALERA